MAPNKVKMKKTWFRRIDYSTVERFLLRRMKNSRSPVVYAIAFIQLKNAARVSEAVEAYRVFCETGKREVKVRVRKHVRDPESRLIVVPREVDRGICRELRKYKDDKTLAKTISTTLRHHLGINTHTLRYLGIMELSKNLPVNYVARITGHRDLSMLIHYIDRITAEKYLVSLLG